MQGKQESSEARPAHKAEVSGSQPTDKKKPISLKMRVRTGGLVPNCL
jgi:hypothetical protein